MKLKLKEPEGDWYAAWLSMTMRISSITWRMRWNAMQCMLLGHRAVVEIPHNEICEQYWDKAHLAKHTNTLERFCRKCDSGYLKSREQA